MSDNLTVNLVVNDARIPRFTAAGRLVEPGEVFDASELNTADFVAKTTPVGNLTDAQLLALVETRGLHKADSPAAEPDLAPVAPVADETVSPPDRDGDGKPGGSMNKAEIAAALTDLGVEFDAKATRDDLGRLLDAKLAEPKA